MLLSQPGSSADPADGLQTLRRTGVLRIAIVLFGVAILDFIYDLSFLDTVYRIVSFIGLRYLALGLMSVPAIRSLIFDATPDRSCFRPREGPGINICNLSALRFVLEAAPCCHSAVLADVNRPATPDV
jgi:hypothetical protein